MGGDARGADDGHLRMPGATTDEHRRVAEQRAGTRDWRAWGPYLSERQWGTVREDYSADGAAWDYFPHEHARARAYRWGEDGLAGVSDEKQHLCLALALWNGRDHILKERLYGLTNNEGNHGEDVKELYYYVDATPSHSWLRMIYKYPQVEFPYARLLDENRRRGKAEPEFELMDTGVFADDRYFDVEVAYAKADVDDLLMQITVRNRGPAAADLHVLPQLWFRNTWTWDGSAKPQLFDDDDAIVARHDELGTYRLYLEDGAQALFCANETNPRALGWDADAKGFFKDGIHERVVRGDLDAVDPTQSGTKAAAWHRLRVPAHGERTVRVRLVKGMKATPFADFDAIVAARRAEADAFYAALQRDIADADARLVQRQAFAGMIWSKQYFGYCVEEWIAGDPKQPPPPEARKHGRNREWTHLRNDDIISMPDAWEYPWYAAWDLAFHCIPLSLIDADFAKQQLTLLTRDWYMHPNGQLPAYEWALGDVNPPVHAWATWRVYQIDRKQNGVADVPFLERIFHKLMLNFTWWVNRKDTEGRNIFQGGFLGLDNIGVFDRSSPLPTGGFINQADGTSWMAMYALNLMRIALELALYNPVYEDIASKFFEHFLRIAEAMTDMGGQGYGLWDDIDKFYYDALHMPDGQVIPLRVRSMVGLIPLFAVETIEPETLERLPNFARRMEWFLQHKPALAQLVSHWEVEGGGKRRLLSLLRGHRMKRLLKRLLDETEFLSPYGVRAISRQHADQPYIFPLGQPGLGQGEHEVRYQPGESESGLFGGNSNWRGPVWFPVNYLLIESLQKFHHYYGDDFTVECPTGSGRMVTINEAANEIATRLTRLFLRGPDGRRACFGDCAKTQDDPHFRDLLLFHEYFHGDNGRGVGASHQTGWTGLIAKLLMPRYRS